eukprot:TRINITY_DN3328_c0_g1_i2.p1 TRINITY_DN3328_c0_g1~~TRINITY_DN3328_c0_g1_i2.p1  ORF type:complete len:460 (-),score=157.92 TRINITY_DN3328_c0_g1_i2:84-1463(-)
MEETKLPFREGRVGEVLLEAKEKGLLLVVFIRENENENFNTAQNGGNEGDSVSDVQVVNDSEKMLKETFSDPEVEEIMSSTPDWCAIQLIWNSQDGKFFTQIYPVIKLPTTYFINCSTGQPVGILAGYSSKTDFLAKFVEITSNFTPNIQPPPLSTSQSVPNTNNLSSSQNFPSSIPTIKTNTTTPTPKPPMPSQKTSIKQQQEQKERQKDLEAKEAVRLKIQQAKLERKSQSSSSSTSSSISSSTVIPSTESLSISNTKPEATSTMINIRMLNGESFKLEFPKDTKLEEVFKAIKQCIENQTKTSTQGLSFMMQYPKKIFTAQDMEHTLEYHGLCPNGVLYVTKEPGYEEVVMIDSHNSNSGTGEENKNGGAGGGGLWSSVWNWVMGGSQTGEEEKRAEEERMRREEEERNEERRRSAVGRSGSGSRGRGVGSNIHGLRREEDSEERSTWNGNSTQQQ